MYRYELDVGKTMQNTCREWAPTSLADNKCVTCFQILIACSIKGAA